MSQQKRRGRPPIAAITKMKIVEADLAIRRRTGVAAASSEEVRQELELSGIFDVPSIRSIQRVLREYREREDVAAPQDAVLDWLDFDQARLPAISLPVLLEAVRVLSERQKASTDDLVAEERSRVQEMGASEEVMQRISGTHLATDRLTIRWARWIWFVHNAIPDESMDLKLDLASTLAIAEQTRDLFGEGPDIDYVVGILAYRPWGDDEAQSAWQQAIARGSVPKTPAPEEAEKQRSLAMLRYSYRNDPHWAEFMELLIEDLSGGLSKEARDELSTIRTYSEDSRKRGGVG